MRFASRTLLIAALAAAPVPLAAQEQANLPQQIADVITKRS